MSNTTEQDRKDFMAKQSECIKDGSWMDGKYFMPGNGRCYHCGGDLIESQIKKGNNGSQLVTGCDYCHRSYCD